MSGKDIQFAHSVQVLCSKFSDGVICRERVK